MATEPIVAPEYDYTSTNGLVVYGWNASQLYATKAFNDANAFIDELVTISDKLADLPDVATDAATPGTIMTAMVLPDAPAAPDGMDMILPPTPAEPTLGAVGDLSLPDAPIFSAQLPDINLNIAKPTDLTASIPAEPTLDVIDMPTEPTLILPDVPTLTSLNLPNAPAINIPGFSATLSDAPMVAPDATFSFTEPTYVSTLLTALNGKLLEWVNGAATGISATVEQALWDRARAREDVASAKALGEVNRAFASRGFSIPPGAMLKATIEVVQESVNKNSALSRDEAIKQADLEQSNRRFAFEQSWQVESGIISHANNVAQRAFDVARYTMQAGIDVFNAMINRFNAQVQAYGVEAEVYKARIQAELAVLEVYKAELEGQKLVGDINMQQVEIYKARIQAVNAMIEMYNGQVNAANTKAVVNKTIIEGFATRVQAYDSLVKAKASEYDAYATQVKAEVSKGDLFKVQADAYGSQVQGYSALVEARVQESNASIKINQEVPLEMFKQRAIVFGELVKAEGTRVGALADMYRSEGSVYQANASAQAARVGAEAEGYKAEATLLLGNANLQIEAAKANLQKMITGMEMLMEATKSGAQVAAQLAASALSSVNLSGSTSVGYSKSDSESRSTSKSDSTSSSTSVSDSTSESHSHFYDETKD